MKKLFSSVLANKNQIIIIHQAIVYGVCTKQLILHKKLVYKTFTHKTKNYIKVDNKYDFDKFDTTAAKKSRKNMESTGFDKKLNGLEAKISQLTH